MDGGGVTENIMKIRALYVDDEPVAAATYTENIGLSLKDTCGIEVEFQTVHRPEDARSLLPTGQDRFSLVFVDMMFRDEGGALRNRGEEVIAQARKTAGTEIIVVTQGDQSRPRLREDCLKQGAQLFAYKQDVQGVDQQTGVSGWDDLASQICELLRGKMSTSTTNAVAKLPNRSEVFVVYGRDGHLRREAFAFLRSLGLRPMEWNTLVAATVAASSTGNPSVLSIIQHGFSVAQGCVVLFSGDDEACLRPDLRAADEPTFELTPMPQPRPNVLVEAGYALGFAPSRTLIVSAGSGLRPISDLNGLHVPRLTNEVSARQDIANRLRGLDLDVDVSGVDWHTAGNFRTP
jgi:predicted nucleotide-binding protein